MIRCWGTGGRLKGSQRQTKRCGDPWARLEAGEGDRCLLRLLVQRFKKGALLPEEGGEGGRRESGKGGVGEGRGREGGGEGGGEDFYCDMIEVESAKVDFGPG